MLEISENEFEYIPRNFWNHKTIDEMNFGFGASYYLWPFNDVFKFIIQILFC